MSNASGNIPNKNNRIIIICVATALVIIAVLVAVIINLLKKPEPPPVVDNTGGRGTVVMPENLDQVREEIEKPVEDGYYEARMNVEWSFMTSKTPSVDAYVANAESNTRTVYFDVILDETGEKVYSSPFIPVGAELTGFALDTDVKAGSHPATVVYHLVDDEGKDLTTVSVAVKLFIKE